MYMFCVSILLTYWQVFTNLTWLLPLVYAFGLTTGFCLVSFPYKFLQVPLHGKFKTRKVLACLDSQYRIVTQCQNIVHVLNEHEKVLKELTDSTECNINDSHNDIIEELIHVQTRCNSIK